MVESLLQILAKRSPTVSKPINVHSVTFAIGESVPSTIMWNILNQSGKQDFSYFSWGKE